MDAIDAARPAARRSGQPWRGLLLSALLIAGCAAAPPSESPSPIDAGSPTPVGTDLPTSTGAPEEPNQPGVTNAPPPGPPSPNAPGPTSHPPNAPGMSPTPSPVVSPAVTGDDLALTSELQRVLERATERRRIPGLAASIVFADGSRWDSAAGLADVTRGIEATPDTRFAVGSITKTFVTALVMQLVEERRLGLDDPLARYVADFPNAAKITIRQLLSHQSGIYNYFESVEYGRKVFSQPAKVWTVKEILAFVKKPYFAPGTGFHYSNTNYILLGAVAEKVTGESIAAEIRDRFLEPLELDDTYFQGEERLPKSGHAHGYLLVQGRPRGLSDGSPIVPNTSAVTVAWAAGAMSSTVRDLGRWATALYSGVVVTQDSLRQMLTFDPRSAYGLGTRTARFELSDAVGHTGSLRGFTSAMWYFPTEQMAVVVSTNLGRINPNAIVASLVRTAFRRLGHPIVPTPSPSPGASPGASPAEPSAPPEAP